MCSNLNAVVFNALFICRMTYVMSESGSKLCCASLTFHITFSEFKNSYDSENYILQILHSTRRR